MFDELFCQNTINSILDMAGTLQPQREIVYAIGLGELIVINSLALVGLVPVFRNRNLHLAIVIF